MNSERIISIILSELSLENLKIQEELEKTINDSEVTINSKVHKVKHCLRDLALNEMMISKFQNIVSPKNNE